MGLYVCMCVMYICSTQFGGYLICARISQEPHELGAVPLSVVVTHLHISDFSLCTVSRSSLQSSIEEIRVVNG